MKKAIATFIVITFMIVVSTTVSAHGHGRRQHSTYTPKYAVCGIQNCMITGLHSHDNITYAAHHYGDGHTYHEYCEAENCTFAGYHEHDGAYCFAHTVNDGHAHYNARGFCH